MSLLLEMVTVMYCSATQVNHQSLSPAVKNIKDKVKLMLKQMKQEVRHVTLQGKLIVQRFQYYLDMQCQTLVA